MADFFSGLAEGIEAGRARSMQREMMEQRKMYQDQQLQLQKGRLNLEREKFGLEKEKTEFQMEAARAESQVWQRFSTITRAKGVGAGLDYLETVKPKEALGMRETIANTKESIARTMKTNAERNGVVIDNKSKEMDLVTKGLDVVAGFGKALDKVPEEEKEAVFQTMLPQLKQIDKNFPEDLESANAYFQGAAGMALPASKIYEEEQKYKRAQSDQIKAIYELNSNQNLTPEDRKALEFTRDQAMIESTEAKAKSFQQELLRSQNSETALRKEYNNLTKNYREVVTAADKALDSLARETAAGDHAGIFAYMKVIDPGSTVREGEFASVENAGGIPNWVRNLYNKTVDGQRISSDMRAQFMDTIKGLVAAQEREYDSVREKYIKIAVDNGLDIERALPDYKRKKEASQLDQAIQGLPENMREQVKQNALEAIKRGADPDAVAKRIEEAAKR